MKKALKSTVSELLTSFDTVLSGAGGSRTRVQTSARYAFYMCIPALIVGRQLEQDEPVTSLSA